MIIRMKIDNFKGISREINFSAIASSKIKRNENQCGLLEEKVKVLKNIGIIGSNGSGKTSFLSAIETLQRFISFPYRKKVSNGDDYVNFIKSMNEEEIKQFLIDFNTLELGEQNIDRTNEDTLIEIEIFAPNRENNISGFYTYKIIYDKSYSKTGVKLEELNYRKLYNSKKNICLYSLNNILESEIGTAVLYENNDAGKNNKNNYIQYYKTFFSEMLDYTDCCYNGVNVNLLDMFEKNKSNFTKLCNIADDKIVDVTIDENEKQNNILFWNKKNNSLKFSQLSEGTRKIVILGSTLIMALENNSVSLIDEIESELHPSLVTFLLELNTSKNEKNCTQLIFTTHSPLIAFSLSNDQLYFINNHNEEYYFSNLTSAVKNKLITKDQNPYRAWLEDLLIKNPDKDKIGSFVNKNMNKKD